MIYTWGTGSSGELFQGDKSKSEVPVQIDLSKKIRSNYASKVVCGQNYTAFLNCILK
jgi:hypothetical protein